MHSHNITDENIAKLAEMFPSCITESKDADGHLTRAIDFDQLKQELSNNIVEGPQERFQLNWPGKRKALLAANTPVAKTFRPCRKESVDFDKTENLFIEGDNLDALKLLQETYLGKVKMIYIDPPYNTGKDFIYADNFLRSADEYFLASGQKDDDGNRLVANTDSNGRFHSDWLSMMYSRLKLARNLLADDGAIFISIDENEQSNLLALCNEIFGEDNFVECISWNKRIPKNDKGIGNIHESCLLFVKERSLNTEFTMQKDGLSDIYDLLSKCKKNKMPIVEAQNLIKQLYQKNGYDRGITLYKDLDENYRLWGKINMSWPNANTYGPNYEVLHPLNNKPVKIPDRGWRWKADTFNEASGRKDGRYIKIKTLHDGSCVCGKIWFGKDETTQPSSITFLDQVNTFLLRSVLSLKSDGGREVEKLFQGKNLFSYPKPINLLKTLISSVSFNEGEVFLDFFAGSGTSAHALMELNAEDSLGRKFIMVQLPEACDENSEPFSEGYKNIADIAKERIRRAGNKIKKDNSLPEKNLDVGFRILKIDDSNMSDVYYSPGSVNQNDLSLFSENIKEDRSEEDLLFQVLLDWGVDLSLPIKKETIAGREVFFVDDNALAACFEKEGQVNEEFCKELAAREPLRVVFRDAGFKDDSVKINVEQIFKLLSPHSDLKCL